MLKEGWDVKNVYVIVPLRAFASQIFTEQVIGRGLRLPFGKWVEDNFKELNRLEIITHDRFQELLKQRETLTKKLFGADSVESIEVIEPQSGEDPKPVLVSQIREKNFTLEILKPKFKFRPPENFSLKSLLADKESQQLLQNLRQKFSSWDDIENFLQRQEFTVTDLNKIETQELEEELMASQQKGELTEIRNKLTKSIIGNFCVQPTLSELKAAEQICQLVVKENNLDIVASNLSLVAYQLNKLIQEFAKTKLDKDTEKSIWEKEGYQVYSKIFAENHGTFGEISSNHNEKFNEQSKQIGYKFQKSLYTYDSFQSGIERKFAVLIDKSKKIKKWIRLLLEDNIYLNYWYNGYRRYYPDFIVIDNDELHYLVETKSEEDRDNEVVRRKSEAANKWVEKLNSKIKLRKWIFLFITEEDINKSGNDWDNLLKITLN
ncbi:MAG: type III restriction endonuclease [Mycoplasmataceae bacterium CE_OT135]|nr:MAG: type III restriction endonuclease [Mycoplasmataceae bacterium CE_OT135]